MAFVKKLTPEQAFQKARHYCGYQERSHAEVKERLYSFGLWKNDVEILLSRLIEENYLNEERFAQQFAGGKFRIKHWGRVKIKHELKQKQVSEYCIRKAMKEIDEEEYMKVLLKLAAQKWKSVKQPGVNRFVKLSKTTAYLLQKGYESELIKHALSELESQL